MELIETMSSPTRPEHDAPSDRLKALELGYEKVSQDMHLLGDNMQRFAKETRDSFVRMEERISSAQKIPWGALGTWSAILVLVITAIGGFALNTVQRQQDSASESLNTLISWQRDHELTEGHLPITLRLQALKERVDLIRNSYEGGVSELSKSIDVRFEAVQNQMMSIIEDISSKTGRIFTRDDYEQYVMPKLDDLVKSLAKLETIVDRIEGRQNESVEKGQ